MLLHLPVIFLIAISMISLNGILGALVNLRERIPGFPEPESCPASHSQGEAEELHPHAKNTILLQNYYPRGIDALTRTTWNSIVTLSLLIIVALITSRIALFIELDILLTIIISLISLVTLALSGLAIKTRYERGT